MADKDYAVNIMVDQVKSVNISRYADGYNYASISSQVADNEYMSIHYEWKGKQIPEFALQAMDIMKALGMEKASVDEDAVAYLERAAKVLTDLAAKTKKENPFVKDKDKDMEDEEDPKKKDKKDKKETKK